MRVTSPNPASPAKRLLIVKPSSLGDIVHGLQVLQSVALQEPDLRITWVVRDRFAGLVEAAPFVNEVILFKRKLGWRAIWDVMKTLRGRRFDAVWDMQGLLRSGLMTWAARAPKKWGRSDSREGAGLFYNKQIPLPSGEGPHHAIAVLLGFLQAAGYRAEVSHPLVLRPAPTFPWHTFFAEDPTLNFVIFTDSRGAEKEWKGFSDLTRLIWDNIPGSRVAWCAGQPASPGGAIPEGRFLNLTGCPFDEMLALARRPSVFIGNDSGPMHLSAASGNRVLAIFGPTSPLRFGPWPIGSTRTQAVVAPGGVLADLKAETVLAALQELRARG